MKSLFISEDNSKHESVYYNNILNLWLERKMFTAYAEGEYGSPWWHGGLSQHLLLIYDR